MRSVNETTRPPSMTNENASRHRAGASSTTRSSSALPAGVMRVRVVHSSQGRTFASTISSMMVMPAARRNASHSRGGVAALLDFQDEGFGLFVLVAEDVLDQERPARREHARDLAQGRKERGEVV